jgi:hypothetical protein
VAPKSEWPCWFPSTLLSCYHYHHRLHEAVELEVCTDRQARRFWSGCTDVTASLELANPLDVPVWTFFVPCCFAPEHACDLAPWAASDSFKLFPKMFEASIPGVDGRGLYGQVELVIAADRQSLQRLVLWSFIVADGVTRDIPRDPSLDPYTHTYLGWAPVVEVQDGARSPHWSQVVRAILMPPRASGRGLVAIAQHVFRLNEQLSAGYHAGELHLEVLQAVDVKIDGHQPLDEYVATANDDFQDVECVMTDAGVTAKGLGREEMRHMYSRELDETATAITFTPLRRTRVPLRSAARE